jgi:hypothetical protein
MEFLVVAAVLLLGLGPLLPWLARHVREYARLAALLAFGLALGALAIAAPRRLPEASITDRPIQVPEPKDVTSSACQACHPGQYASWDASYHSSMTQLPTPQSVRAPWHGSLTAEWKLADGYREARTYGLARRGDDFWLESPDPVFASPRGMEPGARRIALVTGSHHEQFYWYATGDHRRIAQFPLGYSIRQDRWVPIHALLLSPAAKPFDMNGGWNGVCVRCHSTHGRPGFENTEVVSTFAGLPMDTQASEFGIACESCHGGAAAHVSRQQNPLRRYATHFGDGSDDSIVNPRKLDPKRATDICGSCHSVHHIGHGTPEDLAKFNRVGFEFRPGDVLSDTRLIATWANRDDPAFESIKRDDPLFFTNRFWPDGMVSINGRELNGLLETGCYTRGELSCLSCHQMHQARDDLRPFSEWADDQLAADRRGNDACVHCHTGFGEGVTEHTKHAPGSSGSLCYNCHMPHTVYGLLKQSRSHQIDSPDAANALLTGRPTACNLCHLDRPLGWVAKQLETLYGIAPPPLQDPDDFFISYAVVRGLRGDAGSRAMVAWHMGWAPALAASGSDWMVPILAALLEDDYAAVRYIASNSLRALPGFEDFAFDYLAPPETLKKNRADVLARFERTHSPTERTRGEAVLIDAAGRINSSRIERYLAEQDRRYVFRQE